MEGERSLQIEKKRQMAATFTVPKNMLHHATIAATEQHIYNLIHLIPTPSC